MSYTLDSNILINMVRLYPRDIFSSFWDSLEACIDAGEACICEAVLREVHRGGDELHKWAKGLSGFVCEVAAEELATVAAIGQAHPDWVRGQVNEADPFVVAHAKAEGSTLVTEEGLKGPGTEDKNLKIPNVAAEHSVECIKFFDFIRRQGWQF